MTHGALSASSSWIEIVDNEVKVCRDFDTKNISNISSAWTEESFLKYVALLDSFYKRSHFDRFFKSQSDLYKEAELSFDSVYISHLSLNDGWFYNMFGNNLVPIKINLCIGIGPNNYANLYDADSIISILYGCCATYNEKNATYTINSLPIILHEILHIYVNPIVDKNLNAFNNSFSPIYPFVEENLYKANYNWRSVPYEWLTDLALLAYMKDNDSNKEKIETTIISDSTRGFIWQRDSYESLNEFY